MLMDSTKQTGLGKLEFQLRRVRFRAGEVWSGKFWPGSLGQGVYTRQALVRQTGPLEAASRKLRSCHVDWVR